MLTHVHAQISVDFEVCGVRVQDRMVWDLQNEKNEPHVAARRLCQDLRLPSSALQEVSHQIRTAIGTSRAKIWGGTVPLPEKSAPKVTRDLQETMAWCPMIGGVPFTDLPNVLPEASEYIGEEEQSASSGNKKQRNQQQQKKLAQTFVPVRLPCTILLISVDTARKKSQVKYTRTALVLDLLIYVDTRSTRPDHIVVYLRGTRPDHSQDHSGA